ncbi:hypothetical protein [Salinigranum marinum]|uniref:hypothetical protein n=1 Tax=Salinigranum marinum TaxID=1515595 RepID=UPI002989D380|nr:hypothetical protein [Salinigranum marinum]
MTNERSAFVIRSTIGLVVESRAISPVVSIRHRFYQTAKRFNHHGTAVSDRAFENVSVNKYVRFFTY